MPQSPVHFSRRTPSDLRPNRIARARAEAPPRFDLTVSNPTAVGLSYPEGLLPVLADPAGLTYRPHPRGLAEARHAVADTYRRRGCDIDPDHIVLTASTSEAYAFLFKLLCDPGDAVLVPTPSYPLFEHLAALESVVPRPYLLEGEAGWRVDPATLPTDDPLVRALVVVHPNNPTGSPVAEADRETLVSLCARHDWALVADEVFLDYPLTGALPATFAGELQALTFTLGGLSKLVGLPQLKLAWIVVSGPPALVEASLERLDIIADTFLSVATPVQLALPTLLQRGAAVREAILARCRDNLAVLEEILEPHVEFTLHRPRGGWSAALQVPALRPDEDVALDLLRRDSVGVHPGYFYDFPREGYLVVSLLPEPAIFAEGVRRLAARLAAFH